MAIFSWSLTKFINWAAMFALKFYPKTLLAAWGLAQRQFDMEIRLERPKSLIILADRSVQSSRSKTPSPRDDWSLITITLTPLSLQEQKLNSGTGSQRPLFLNGAKKTTAIIKN